MIDSTKRVCILVDTQTHMMPALAKEMASRNHNLVIGNVKDGLPEELAGMGAEVERRLEEGADIPLGREQRFHDRGLLLLDFLLSPLDIPE